MGGDHAQFCWMKNSRETERAVDFLAACGASFKFWQGPSLLDGYMNLQKERE